MKSSQAISFIAIGFVLICAAVFAIEYFNGGVRVVVQNVGKTELRDVTVAVTGNSYRLGDLGPSESGATVVEPTGESSVSISYIGPDDERLTFDADCYVEANGYRGLIEVEISEHGLEHTNNLIKLSPW